MLSRAVILALALGAVPVLGSLPALAQPADPPPGMEVASTALLVQPLHAARWVPADDGKVHVEYDLLVTNTLPVPANVTVVEVMDPSGHMLGYSTGPDLAPRLQALLDQKPLSAIPANGVAVIEMDLPLDRGEVPEHLTHRIAYEAPDASERIRTLLAHFEIEGPQVALPGTPPLAIRPPVEGEDWLALRGCCRPNMHRNARVAAGTRIGTPELFAIDYVRLEHGAIFSGDGTRVSQYSSFGAPVRAVADGTVVAVQDGLDDNIPQKPITTLHIPRDLGGNFVLQQLAPHVYAFYAHLKKGSVAVKAGDALKAGARLGALGSSGDATVPHLHFGLLDRPDFITGNSLPFVYDAFTLTGHMESPDGAGPPRIEPQSQSVSAAAPLVGDIATYE